MSQKIQDLIIVGSGPCSLAAALYTSREDIDTTIYERLVVGGLVATIDKVDNYPGFPDGIEGYSLVESMEKQAKRFGAKLEYGEVKSIEMDGNYKLVKIDDKVVKAKAVLIATGRSYAKIGAPGEVEFFGKGVHYCATCDGAFYRGKKLAVVGGANSAIQEAIYLTRFASHVDVLVRSTIKATKVLQKELAKLEKAGKVTVHLATTVEEILATDEHVSSLTIKNKDGVSNLEVDGVFIFAGLKPNTGFLKNGMIDLTQAGFIKTDKTMETNMSGVFAAGDVRHGATMQIASAVGDGVTAAISIREYLKDFEG